MEWKDVIANIRIEDQVLSPIERRLKFNRRYVLTTLRRYRSGAISARSTALTLSDVSESMYEEFGKHIRFSVDHPYPVFISRIHRAATFLMDVEEKRAEKEREEYWAEIREKERIERESMSPLEWDLRMKKRYARDVIRNYRRGGLSAYETADTLGYVCEDLWTDYGHHNKFPADHPYPVFMSRLHRAAKFIMGEKWHWFV